MFRILLGLFAATAGALLILVFVRAGGGPELVRAAVPQAPATAGRRRPPELVVPDSKAAERPASSLPVAEDEPEEELPEFDGPPPDPVGVGDATLALSLVDRESGEPVAGPVLLWRLGAPATEYWLAGDQVQARRTVPKIGAVFERLPEGQYRVLFVPQSAGAEDPASFRVQGALTTMQLLVDGARRRPAYLKLFDEEGRPIERAEIQRNGTTFESRSPLEADWIQARTCRIDYPRDDAPAPDGGRFLAHDRWVKLEATSRGLALGEFPVDPRDKVQRSPVRVRVEGRSEVEFEILGSDVGERAYVSVSVDPAGVLRRLIRPDGSTCEGSDVNVEVRAGALPWTGSSPDDAWRQVPLVVTVKDARYAPLTLELRLADGEPADRFLLPAGD